MSFCKHRVMDKCKKDGKLCIYRKACFEPEEQKPITNADHIRSMTDEELAKWLADTWDCNDCSEHERLGDNPLLRDEQCDQKCEQHCLDWLKQHYKGVNK